MGEDTQKHHSISALSVLSHLGVLQNAIQEQTRTRLTAIPRSGKLSMVLVLLNNIVSALSNLVLCRKLERTTCFFPGDKDTCLSQHMLCWCSFFAAHISLFSFKLTLTGTHLSRLSANPFSFQKFFPLTVWRAVTQNITFYYISWFDKRWCFCCQHPLTIRKNGKLDFQAEEGDLLG